MFGRERCIGSLRIFQRLELKHSNGRHKYRLVGLVDLQLSWADRHTGRQRMWHHAKDVSKNRQNAAQSASCPTPPSSAKQWMFP